MNALREQIAEIVRYEVINDTDMQLHPDTLKAITGQILALLTQIPPELQVEEECKQHMETNIDKNARFLCGTCQGAGKIYRQATWSDVLQINFKYIHNIATVEDCGCGFPCDCYSWAWMSRTAKLALTLPDGSRLIWREK